MALSHLLPELVLDELRRRSDLAHLNQPVQVVDPIDGHLASQVTQLGILYLSCVSTVRVEAPSFLDNMRGNIALFLVLSDEELDAPGSALQDELVHTWDRSGP